MGRALIGPSLATVGAIVTAEILLWTGIEHLLRPAHLREALGSSVRPAVARLLVRAVPVLELGCGLAVAGGLAGVVSPRLAGLAAAFLLASFAAYTTWSVLRGTEAPCGCSANGSASWVVAARALILALLAFAGGATSSIRLWSGDEALLVLMATTASIVIWLAPGFLELGNPDRDRAAGEEPGRFHAWPSAKEWVR